MPSIAPGTTAEVAIPGWQLPPAGAGERWLTLRFLTAEAAAWAGAGYEIGWAQVPLDDAEAAGPAAEGAATPHQGWTGDVAVDDEGYLLHPAFAAPPALSLWRAPTDNDRIGGMAGRWDGWGLASLVRRLEAVERGDDAVTVRATWTTAAGIEIAHAQRLSSSPDGRIRVEETVWVPSVVEDLARVGTVLELAAGHEDFEWFGRGPHETYPDRRRGGRVGRVAVDRGRPARPVHPAAGERRSRRHALVPGRVDGWRDPRGPRPARAGVGDARDGRGPRRRDP